MLYYMKYLLFSLFFVSCMSTHPVSNARVYALRLRPGQDLKREIVAFAQQHQIEAGYIITCVGSLQKVSLRLANQPAATEWEDKFEIVSLTGTLSANHGVHLHAAVSDGTGKTIGGHVTDGNIVYTTAEIVIGDAQDLRFTRPRDSVTTYNELFIEQK